MKKQFFPLLAMLFLCNSINAQSNYVGSGIAIELNGDNSNYIDLDDVYNELNFPLTIEAWVYPTDWTVPGDYAPIFATDNSSIGSYYGFWFRFNSTGKLIFEIGDGSGSGSTDRRGKVTSNSVALNEWTHIAVVATSVTDIKFYFNGMLQTASNTDGGASNISILHNSNPAAIGHHITQFNEHNFIGRIDEVRVWASSRTESQIRSYMCQKISDIPDNMVGYWNFDESYASLSAVDITSPAEDGILEGTVLKVTSGAPIGNESTFIYTNDWTGVKLAINHDNGDLVRVRNIINEPKGFHLYRVDQIPYDVAGLGNITDYYFGAFPVDDEIDAGYMLLYRFSPANGVITPDNFESATLNNRLDGSITFWTNLGAVLLDPNPFFKKTGNSGRQEVILNIPNAALEDGAVDSRQQVITPPVVIYPNPATNCVQLTNLELGDLLLIQTVNGGLVQSLKVQNLNDCMFDISDYSIGVYYVQVVRGDLIITTSTLIKN